MSVPAGLLVRQLMTPADFILLWGQLTGETWRIVPTL